MARRSPRLLVAGLTSALLGWPIACKDDPELSFEAEEGGACENCEECAGLVSSCICDTCTEYAFDHSTNVLLTCVDSRWEFDSRCPGGGSVSCGQYGGYELVCLSEHGKPIPLSLIGRAGEPCEQCDDCRESPYGDCVCHRCSELVFDRESNQMLLCSDDGVWTRYVDCAGGGALDCVGPGYAVECRDETGQEIPVPVPP